MGAFPVLRFFRLSDEGVRCDENGLFVGGAPMLACSQRPGGGYAWAARPLDEQNRDLGARYGFPVDIAVKRIGMAGVARALEHGDLALAQISALLLRFPDPPSLAKGAPEGGSAELARQLIESGLLKADWDSSKHPRTGEPPNPGWFAPKDDAPVQVAANDFEPKPTMTDAGPGSSEFAPMVDERKPLATIEAAPEPPPKGEHGSEPVPETEPETAPPEADLSPREVMKTLRDFLKQESFSIIQMGGAVEWASSKISDAIATAIATLMDWVAFSPAGVDLAVERALEEARASADPPKTLAELQAPPTQDIAGYDDHHLVQQNDGNIAKSPFDVRTEKFGWNVINAPSNRVWIPPVKHRLITDWYNCKDPHDPNERLRRQVVSDMDFEAQYQDALATLRMFGVLQ
ncbi:MAG: hypothetical protein ABR929_06515 [Roseiarcus sp.]